MTAIQSTTTVQDDTKRAQIRNYFAKLNLVLPIILLMLGLFLLLFQGSRFLGILLAIGGGAWLFFQTRPALNSPSDETIDTWLRQDMEHIKKRSLERLNLDESQLIRDSLTITGPILWKTTSGVPANEITFKKGKDGRVRFSVNAVTIIHLTENKLSSYQCDYNFIRGASLNERDDEYYYKDVVAVSTREASTNYTLPNNQVMKQAQSFTLSVSSGEQIGVIITSADIVKLTGGEVVDTGVDSSIRAIRKVLGEKKV
jgi:hypothetical protein